MEFFFLDLLQIVAIHQDQLDRYGGERGLRDIELLNSAIAMPQAGFGDEYLHKGVFEMAAAYLFHIVKNHAFLDGNKRTGTAAALVFLELHGYKVPVSDDELVDLTLRVVNNEIGKPEVAEFFQARSVPSDPPTAPSE